MSRLLGSTIMAIALLAPVMVSAQTRCADGSWSNSSGSGTCSWHGGISESDPGSDSTNQLLVWMHVGGYGFSVIGGLLAMFPHQIHVHEFGIGLNISGLAFEAIALALDFENDTNRAHTVIGAGLNLVGLVANIVQASLSDPDPHYRLSVRADGNSAHISLSGVF